jgi:hypothetical protein
VRRPHIDQQALVGRGRVAVISNQQPSRFKTLKAERFLPAIKTDLAGLPLDDPLADEEYQRVFLQAVEEYLGARSSRRHQATAIRRRADKEWEEPPLHSEQDWQAAAAAAGITPADYHECEFKILSSSWPLIFAFKRS